MHARPRAIRRPIRELIWPDVEHPLPTRSGIDERRRYHRYARDRCYALLLLNGVGHVSRCVDLGYGGMRIVAPPEAPLTCGALVQVRLDRWARTFEDQYSVCALQPARDGTVAHLALEPPEDGAAECSSVGSF